MSTKTKDILPQDLPKAFAVEGGLKKVTLQVYKTSDDGLRVMVDLQYPDRRANQVMGFSYENFIEGKDEITPAAITVGEQCANWTKKVSATKTTKAPAKKPTKKAPAKKAKAPAKPKVDPVEAEKRNALITNEGRDLPTEEQTYLELMKEVSQ